MQSPVCTKHLLVGDSQSTTAVTVHNGAHRADHGLASAQLGEAQVGIDLECSQVTVVTAPGLVDTVQNVVADRGQPGRIWAAAVRFGDGLKLGLVQLERQELAIPRIVRGVRGDVEEGRLRARRSRGQPEAGRQGESEAVGSPHGDWLGVEDRGEVASALVDAAVAEIRGCWAGQPVLCAAARVSGSGRSR